MGEHYVCQGECNGVSDTAGTCSAESCSKRDQDLMACSCEGGADAHRGESKETNTEHAAHM